MAADQLTPHEENSLLRIADGAEAQDDVEEAAVSRLQSLALVEQRGMSFGLTFMGVRKVARLKQTSLLLVEREEQIVGTIDDRALAADHDQTTVAAAMRPLATSLRPATPMAEARELFIRARASILPIVAGSFIIGAVTRGDVEHARA